MGDINQHKQLQLKTIEIHERAKALQNSMPKHLKLVPEIRQTLALVNDISEVLLCLTKMQGENHAHNH